MNNVINNTTSVCFFHQVIAKLNGLTEMMQQEKGTLKLLQIYKWNIQVVFAVIRVAVKWKQYLEYQLQTQETTLPRKRAITKTLTVRHYLKEYQLFIRTFLTCYYSV